MRAPAAFLLLSALVAGPVSAQDLASGAPEADLDARQSVVWLRTGSLSPGEIRAVQAFSAVPPQAWGTLAVDGAASGNLVSRHSVARHDEVLSTEARVAMALAGITTALTFTQVAFARGYDGFALLAPLVGGVTAYEAGELFGYHGDPMDALKWIAIGAAPGAALMGLGVVMAPNGGGEDGLPTAALTSFLTGYVLYLVLPPILIARAHHPTISPEVQVALDGRVVPVLSLSVGL